ncbi:MAG: bifunctional DedA family/phosphatase PAP2 family protein [Solirubrobacterales bacterium]
MRIALPKDRRVRWVVVVAIALVAITAFIAFTTLIDVEQALEDVSHVLGAWTYLLVGIFAFGETGAFVGLLVPGETTMILGGATAGQGATNVYILIAIAWFAAWAGDTTSFLIGRRLGREFVLRHGPRFGIDRERFEMVEGYFERHGGKTILIGRFVGIVRALAPFVAGSSGMRYRAFLPYCILGTGLWVSSAIVLGYVFSRNIDAVLDYAGKGAFVLGALIVVVGGSIFLYRFLRVPENRERSVRWMDQHRATRWLVSTARRFAPQLRFLGARLTPGTQLGLEFTSLMSILAVAGFVLVAYTSIVVGDAGPTPGDRTAADVVSSLQTEWLTDVADAVTELGSDSLILPIALLCALALAAGRRWTELGVLVAGLAIIHFAVPELKDTVARPRPGDAVAYTGGYAFPSGHAANATFYVWLAVTIVMRLRPGMARGALVVAAGIALTAAVGLSRVYLDVHYMSDVNAGWALGAAAFAVCAAVALVATTLRSVRQNDVDG